MFVEFKFTTIFLSIEQLFLTGFALTGTRKIEKIFIKAVTNIHFLLLSVGYTYHHLTDNHLQQFLYIQTLKIDEKKKTRQMCSRRREVLRQAEVDEARKCASEGLTIIAILNKTNTIAGFAMNVNWVRII